MAGVLTAVLARGVRHSLGVAGIALVVAGAVAFFPTGSSGATTSDAGVSPAASTSIDAMRSVFVVPAEASASQDETTPTPEAPGLAAVAPPTLESNVSAPATAGPPSPTEAAFGQAVISSALQQSTPAATVSALTPEAVVTAAPRTSVSIPAIEAILAQSPWPRETWPTVERIILCESSGNPAAVSPAGYVGLMQVAPWLHGAVPADPVAQLAQAYEVYLRQGWGAWGCY
ncbi:MAG: transglycosylase SLT domain-containing protein [Dehalococcoidia bacterium]